MSGVEIRLAVPADAARLAEMMNRLNAHEGIDDTVFSERKVLDHAFGSEPAYRVMVAEARGSAVGYASFEDFFNTDLCEQGLWVIDLFVEHNARRRGVGRALMAAVARWAVAHGRTSLAWGVLPRNRRAWAFYESLGAVEDPGRIMALPGCALLELAACSRDEENRTG